MMDAWAEARAAGCEEILHLEESLVLIAHFNLSNSDSFVLRRGVADAVMEVCASREGQRQTRLQGV